LRPSPVLARINSRSNSASPPSTVSISRPCDVVVSAQASARTRSTCWSLMAAICAVSLGQIGAGSWRACYAALGMASNSPITSKAPTGIQRSATRASWALRALWRSGGTGCIAPGGRRDEVDRRLILAVVTYLLLREGSHEAARFHHGSRWLGGVAAGGAWAAVDDAGDRLSRQQFSGRVASVGSRVRAGIEGQRLRRGPRRGDLIPLGGRSL
jgi:hypothetical protein